MSTIVPPRRLDSKSLLAGVECLVSIDSGLARVVERHGPPPLWERTPGFATLIQIILEQQVSLASGAAVYRRLEQAFGSVTIRAVQDAGVSGLRDLGITRQKAGYCVLVAGAVSDGSLDFGRISQASVDDARQELMAVKGIGAWTSDVYLLMAVGAPDVWPRGDVALLTALQHLRDHSERPSPDDAQLEAEKWSPWRSVAARILWHGYLSGTLRSSRGG